MLIRLLDMINNKKISNFSMLSQKLEVNEKILKQMIQELVNANCIEPLDKGQNRRCSNFCSGKGLCAAANNSLASVKLLKITEKGKDLVTNQPALVQLKQIYHN